MDLTAWRSSVTFYEKNLTLMGQRLFCSEPKTDGHENQCHECRLTWKHCNDGKEKG